MLGAVLMPDWPRNVTHLNQLSSANEQQRAICYTEHPLETRISFTES